MHHNLCDACETVVHCSKHGCVPLQQLAHAEELHSSKGYELGTKEGYEAFAKLRADSLAESLGLEPPPTYEEMLHELWYLRRRVKQLEKQLLNYQQNAN